MFNKLDTNEQWSFCVAAGEHNSGPFTIRSADSKSAFTGIGDHSVSIYTEVALNGAATARTIGPIWG